MNVVIGTADLMISSRCEHAARQARRTCRLAGTAEALREVVTELQPTLVILDLEWGAAPIESLVSDIRSRSESATIVAFGPHVHAADLESARAAGCDHVLSRGQFDQRLAEILAGRA